MIYLVSKNTNLFESTRYKQISLDEALEILNPLKEIQLDTETEGLNFNIKKLLTIQLGNKDNQVVFDWQTMDKEERAKLKELLEDPNKTFNGWNLL